MSDEIEKYEVKADKRFFAKVRRNPDTECWEWQANATNAGYGLFRYRSKTYVAHRWLAWRFDMIKQLGGRHPVVCHSCDNPRCVYPGHLFVGSQSDNVRDAMSKGRHVMPINRARGESAACVRLNEEKVLEIRTKYNVGERSYRELANEYSVGKTTIENIIKRRTWTHI